MIYLFDRAKKLQKIIPRKHIINANPTVVRNGIYQLAVEVPLFYEDKKGTQYNYQKSVSKATFAGHYDVNGRFQLYKIYSRNIIANEQGEFLIFDGVHIFFDEAKAMGNIHDRRFRDSEAKAPADAAFNSIGWTVIDYDVTDRHDINFYRASVTDAWNDLISTYGVEFDYELQFDGRKIISKNIIMKKQIGKWTGQRFAYGTNVLTLTQEQDESEVYTAAVGRGRGEESGDGFGPRLEFGDIEWSKDGITKPVGQNYIELPSATAEYGFIENGVVKPRIAPEVVFENIEDKKKLADSTYYWLLENCVPKATWKTEVARIGNLELGDTVGVLYKAAGIIKRARVEKIEYNLLDPELSKLTLGDFHHFENRQMKRINAQIKRLDKDSNDRITRIKNEWNAWFDNQFTAAMNQFEQNLIDQQAQIEADRENMTNLINTKTEEFDASLSAGMAEAEQKRQENYDAISDYVNTTVDNTRSELETSINTSIDSANEYAEQQAQAKADAVKTELETVTNGHQQMLNDLESNVMNIDDFIGDSRSVTLDERFQDITMNFEERIRNIDSTHYNIVRGTSFDDPDLMLNHGQTEIITNETDNFARLGLGTTALPYLMLREYFNIEAGETYNLIFTYRTADVPEIDFIRLRPPGGSEGPYGGDIIVEDNMTESEKATTLTNQWTKKTVSFVSDRDMPVRLMIGTNFGAGNTQRGILDIKKPYLTTTNNREWLPHPDDDAQNVSEVIRRVTLLEDGRSELITRSEYDFETGQIDQYIKSVEESVEGNKTVLQRVEDWQVTNGSSIEETIYGFNQKVWLNDVANIGANLIPQSANAWENGGLWIEGGGESGNLQNIRTKKRIEVQPNTTYTLSSNSAYVSAIERVDIHQYLTTGGWINRRTIPRNGEVTFTTWGTAGTVRINLVSREGFSINPNFIDHPDGRIKIKLEVGSSATPMLNAISRFEQLADKVAIQVQELDGDFLTQSDIQVQAGYVQLGSQRLGDEQLASIFRVSPNSIDAITERMTLNGSLYVDGDITALAVEAVEGNFARLFANQVEANTINVDYIKGRTAWFESQYTRNSNIEKLVSQIVFTDAINAKVGNFIDLNAGSIVTAGLSANIVTSDHIQVGTALVDKMFATSARIDQLITKTHFVNEMHALTLNVVDLNASHIRSRLLTANTIEASWIKSGTALLDRVFSSTAMFERMMAKSGFVTTLNTVTIDTDQLTIRRPDGVAWVSNGMARFDIPVQVQEYMDTSVEWTGQRYVTNSRGTQKCAILYTSHAGRYLRIGLTTGMRYNAQHASTHMGIVIRPENSPSGTNWQPMIEEKIVYKSGNDYKIYEIDLGKPTFAAASFSLEFYRIGDSVENPVTLRIHRAWITG